MEVWKPYLDEGSQVCNGHQRRYYVADDFTESLALLLIAVVPLRAGGEGREGREGEERGRE